MTVQILQFLKKFSSTVLENAKQNSATGGSPDLSMILDKLNHLQLAVEKNGRRQKATDLRLASLTTIVNDNKAAIAELSRKSEGTKSKKSRPLLASADSNSDDECTDDYRSLVEASDESNDVSSQYIAIKDCIPCHFTRSLNFRRKWTASQK
jgi:organic radical activating enzyme